MGTDWGSWGDYQANPADHEGFGPVGYHDNPYTTGEAYEQKGNAQRRAESGVWKLRIKFVLWAIIGCMALTDIILRLAGVI